MRKKYAAGVTLYNPSLENINNINLYSEMFDYVFVYDNSLSNENYISYINQNDNVIYTYGGKNLGLPQAFNSILEICDDKNIDILCTFDQDSYPSEDLINSIKKYINNNDISNVAIVAPNPKNYLSKKNNDNDVIIEVKWVICSGSFINVKLVKSKNIMYDNNYFIDRFDADFCKQIINNQMKILMFENKHMYHLCGDDKQRHNIFRHFYIFRNRYYYNDKYYCYPINKLLTKIQNIRHIITILTCEDKKRLKLKMLNVAKREYQYGNMGIISLNAEIKINRLIKRSENKCK